MPIAQSVLAPATLLLAAALAFAAPCVRADDDAPTYAFGARLQIDHDRHDGLYSADGGRERETYLRRATAELAGRLHKDWDYALEIELDEEGAFGWRTAAVGYTGLRLFDVSAGRMKPEFGLEESTSSKWSTGIERSALWDLASEAVERSNGIALARAGDGYRLSLAGFRRADHDALVARAVLIPLHDERRALHLGVSHADERIERSNGSIRSRLAVQGVTEGRGGNRSTLAPSAGRGAYGADRSWVAEFAYAHGPYSVQAEWLQRRLDAAEAAGDRRATGFYVQLAWTLTGEPRPYDAKGARFQAIRPGGDGGAWELFVRHDLLRVRGGAGASDPEAVDTRARVQVLGLNWYVNRSVKLSLNALRARTNRPDNDADSRRGDALSVRLQWLL